MNNKVDPLRKIHKKMSFRFVRFVLGVIIGGTWSNHTWPLDERYFRELVLENLNQTYEKEVAPKKSQKEKPYSFVIPGPMYQLDLNFDGTKEYAVYGKKEQEDWLSFYNSEDTLIFKTQFESSGHQSKVYKIRISHIDQDIGLIIVYFYEGLTKYFQTDALSRVYFISFRKKNLEDFKVHKGPYLFHEHKGQKGHYSMRNRQLEVLDLNGDGRNEIVLKHDRSSEVISVNRQGDFF